MTDHSEPRWERGYRCHGYWIGIRRVGAVSLSQPGFPLEYTAYLDQSAGQTWRYKTLQAAKRRVEKEFRKHGSF